MKNCIVTGGAGYVGSHCCKELARAGYQPVAVDNLCRGHAELVKWGPLHEIDVLDGDSLDCIFDQYQPIAVFHFAGLAFVGESVERPDIYYGNNTAGTLSVLNAMIRNSCTNMIFSSTAATYGLPQYLPIDENHPKNPINPYGWSKLFVEQIMRDYENSYGIKHAALRFFNACGADKECETGELHDPETHLIPSVIQAALGIRDNIKIYGNDYDTPDGTAIRDYIHVSDLAIAHVKALERLLSSGESSCINIGTGNGYSVMEVIESVKRISGKNVSAIFEKRRAGDTPILIADSSKARTELNWRCLIPEIDNIVETAWNWHSKRPVSN